MLSSREKEQGTPWIYNVKQSIQKRRREGQRVLDNRYGIRSKATRAKIKKEQLWQDFQAMQFDRALNKAFVSGTATPEDLSFIDSFGVLKEELITKRGNRVIITLVDISSFPKEPLH